MSRVALTCSIGPELCAVVQRGYAGRRRAAGQRKAVAKTLKAANDALQAKNYDEVLNKTREAQAMTPRSCLRRLRHSLHADGRPTPPRTTIRRTAKAIESDHRFAIPAGCHQAAAAAHADEHLLPEQGLRQGHHLREAVAARPAIPSPDTPLTIAQANYLNGKLQGSAGRAWRRSSRATSRPVASPPRRPEPDLELRHQDQGRRRWLPRRSRS